jgi:hypothetical protein
MINLAYIWLGSPENKKLKRAKFSWEFYLKNPNIVKLDEEYYHSIPDKPLFITTCFELGQWSYVSDFMRLHFLSNNPDYLYLDADVELNSFYLYNILTDTTFDKYLLLGYGENFASKVFKETGVVVTSRLLQSKLGKILFPLYLDNLFDTDNISIRTYVNNSIETIVYDFYINNINEFKALEYGKDIKDLNMSLTTGKHSSLFTKYPHLEYQITTNCNLKCKSCMQFSPLSNEKPVPLEKVISDLKKIQDSKLPDFVSHLVLIGGEPTTHPDVIEIMKQARQIFGRDFTISLTTNGKLLSDLSNEFYETVQSNNIIVGLSAYPSIKLNITKLQVFGCTYSTRNNANSWNKLCIGNKDSLDIKCPYRFNIFFASFKDDKVYRCPIMAYSYLFENTFPDYPVKLNKEYLMINDIKNDETLFNKFIFSDCGNLDICGCVKTEYGLSEKSIEEWT